MKYRLLFLIFFCITALYPYAENTVMNTADITENTEELFEEEKIKNVQFLEPVFEKLMQLEKNRKGKVNIVHIGDSHIQADVFTNAVRQPLQDKFGNGGYGLTFPYNLTGGNNVTRFFRFTSNVTWQTCRNNQAFKCDPGTQIGLGGYGFTSRSNQLVISMDVNEDKYKFNTIKILSPYETSCFKLATAEGNPVIQSVQSGVKYHKIKSGESLSVIASKYKVSVAAIKKANGMSSNNIYAGKNLKIPTVVKETKVNMSLFKPLEYTSSEQYVSTYHSNKEISKIYLLPNENNTSVYNLNGIVLENDNPGVIYHSVGVIGSKASDFTATPLFFKQLPSLAPDMVILSFGTNESYGKVSAADFMFQMEDMIKQVQKVCPDVPVLVMTPPTSLLRRRALNTLASEYSALIMQKNDWALWDLYSFTGGLTGARQPMICLIASDNVHYTAQGYINQGSAFVYDFLNEYEIYKNSHELKDNDTQEEPSLPEFLEQQGLTENTDTEEESINTININ